MSHNIAAQRQQRLKEMARKGPQAGDVMKDGTVFAGLMPDTGKALYVMPADEAVAVAYVDQDSCRDAANRKKYLGHDDWRVPTLQELNVLFAAKEKGALRGTFNGAASGDGIYLSSTPAEYNELTKDFRSGEENLYDSVCAFSVRLVR